jgi:hypothetical protein
MKKKEMRGVLPSLLSRVAVEKVLKGITPPLSNIHNRKFHTSSINYLKNSSSSSTSNDVLTSKETNNFLDSVKNIINNPNYTPHQAQEIIETSWMDIVIERLKDPKYLSTRYSQMLSNNIKAANATLEIYRESGELLKKFPFLIYNKKESMKYLLLTFAIIIAQHHKLKYTALSVEIGKALVFHIYTLNKKNKSIKKETTYPDFTKNLQIDMLKILSLGTFFLDLYSQIPHDLVERVQNHISYNRFDLAYIKIKDKHLEQIRNNIIVHPFTLPMICEPVEWSATSFGGYLVNKDLCKSIINKSLFHKHSTDFKLNLYNAINYLNRIKFSINSKLLDFINSEGKYLLEEIPAENLLQRTITLKIAEAFANCNKPFYLCTNADWRGRIYIASFFINYQGSDLASAILEFWDGEPLTESGREYLYIYGANNHNQDNISKDPIPDRINWVIKNYDKIINLDRDLIISAENPFIFASFCLSMRELHINPNAIIKLPVFLDATCNGILGSPIN